MSDTKLRSIVKTISWRIIAFCTTIFLTILIFGDIALSFLLTVLGTVISAIEYFLHERIWNKIKWGLDCE